VVLFISLKFFIQTWPCLSFFTNLAKTVLERAASKHAAAANQAQQQPAAAASKRAAAASQS
jgi:hypothetical protein